MKPKTCSLRPCVTISKRSRKKRCVVLKEAEEVVEANEADNEATEDEDEDSVIMIDEGDNLDVKAFLSSKSRDFLVTTKGGEVIPIDSLEGKYVIVCCFLLPFDLDSNETSICRCIEALFAQLSVQGIADTVKLVLVGNVSSGSRVPNFNRFFGKLSLNCLAIPYSDSKSRDRICRALELSEYDQPCLVVHPSGTVLQLPEPFLMNYGAQSFPFTQQHFDNILTQDENIKSRIRSVDSSLSLGELLQCDSLSLIGDGNISIPTSDLDHDDIPVGIYLCFDGFRKGGFMFDLQDIHQKCLDKGHKFEIVLIPVPFGRYSDPLSFYDRIKKSAFKNTTSSSWWTIPFSDKVCRSLWRLFYRGEKDELIILPRCGHPGDLFGRHMATVYGADAYPFTRDVIIERRLRELRSVTLAQMVGDSYMSDLRNKNVLLYLDYPRFDYDDGYLFKTIYHATREIKVIYPDNEVVFVPLERVSSARERRIKKTWPVLPQEMCESVIKHIFKKDEGNPGGQLIPSLVAFGKDGKILSRRAERRLPGWTFSESESLFDDTLASEIFSNIKQRM